MNTYSVQNQRLEASIYLARLYTRLFRVTFASN